MNGSAAHRRASAIVAASPDIQLSADRKPTRRIAGAPNALANLIAMTANIVVHQTGYRPIFLHPTLRHGVLTWDEGNIDIAPEYVYEHSYAYDGVVI